MFQQDLHDLDVTFPRGNMENRAKVLISGREKKNTQRSLNVGNSYIALVYIYFDVMKILYQQILNWCIFHYKEFLQVVYEFKNCF